MSTPYLVTTHLDTKAVSGKSKLKKTSFASDAVFSTVCVTSVDAYLGIILKVLDKDSIELKVLVLINSDVKHQAFDCGEDKERSELILKGVPILKV